LGKVGENAVVLNFCQCNKIGRMVGAGGNDEFTKVMKFCMVATPTPTSGRRRQEEIVVAVIE
jgi:hypothetical protein